MTVVETTDHPPLPADIKTRVNYRNNSEELGVSKNTIINAGLIPLDVSALFYVRPGESALEVGLSGFPGGSTTQTWPAGQGPPGQDQPIHMLPVFRLPEVGNNPAGGFLRRLPREETQRERESRVKEAEELEKMKTALGLTDRELEALEEELLLPERGRRGRSPAAAAARSPNGDRSANDGLDDDLEKDPQDVLYGPDSALGKQQQQQQRQPQHESHPTYPLGGKRRRRGAGRRAADARPRRDKSRRSPTRDETTVLDLPTPRVLRRTPHSTLGADLAASKALSVRRTGEGKKTGPWTSTGEIGLGIASGSVLGTTVSTEQLVAAAADVGMVNLLELRRELGRSVGQVRVVARRYVAIRTGAGRGQEDVPGTAGYV